MADGRQAESAPDLGRPKIAEGVDFIETEEDAEAVESAVVKIQSTFRGKKIRSKLGQKQAAGAASKQPQGSAAEQASRVEPRQEEEAERAASAASKTSAADKSEPAEGEQHEELGGRLSRMQVNDNSSANKGPQNPKQAGSSSEEEAERAATKIQAGFKGYKTRKELESKSAGQQAELESGANS